MKKIIISILALATISISANANWYAGGGLAFGFSSNNGTSNTTFGIAPEAGYKFSDKCAAGLSLDFSVSSIAFSGERMGSFQFTVNPYFRYNFVQFGPVTLFGDAVVALGTTKEFASSKEMSVSSSPAFIWGVSVQPGLSVAINDAWSLVGHIGGIGYAGTKNTGAFQINLLNQFSIGIFRNF